MVGGTGQTREEQALLVSHPPQKCVCPCFQVLHLDLVKPKTSPPFLLWMLGDVSWEGTNISSLQIGRWKTDQRNAPTQVQPGDLFIYLLGLGYLKEHAWLKRNRIAKTKQTNKTQHAQRLCLCRTKWGSGSSRSLEEGGGGFHVI